MNHDIKLDLNIESGGFVTAQPVCACGWSGYRHDVGTEEGRGAYERNEREHRTAVRAANGCGYVMLAVGIGVIGVYLVGAVYLITLFLGLF